MFVDLGGGNLMDALYKGTYINLVSMPSKAPEQAAHPSPNPLNLQTNDERPRKRLCRDTSSLGRTFEELFLPLLHGVQECRAHIQQESRFSCPRARCRRQVLT